ncbi:hypothetical protein P12x_000723 [Tundrisphaera lichenicola]|uniref:hypothetical protein n=1 Tax=Tundrisphaera lichenicola TaxID=2029860 RepID=UPI003EBEE95A
MKLRIPDLLLILALIAGGVLAWQTARERTRLEVEHQRLARATGDLRIGDPTKVHILALETGDPLSFAWRVYLPPNYPVKLKIGSPNSGSMGSGSSGSTESREFIARLRVRADESGSLQVFEQFGSGGGMMSLGDKSLADFLMDRSGSVIADEMGKKQVETIDPDGSAILLRLSMPEEMQAEARKTLSPHALNYVPILLEMRLGPEPPPVSPNGPGN